MKTYSPDSLTPSPGGNFVIPTSGLNDEDATLLLRAQQFAQPLLAGQCHDSGEDTYEHAQATARIVQGMGAPASVQAAVYLVYACGHLNKPQEVISKAFGPDLANLATETRKLMRVQRNASLAQSSAQLVEDPSAQTETVRKMLLAFSRDMRVIMLRLASRLQSMRYYAAAKKGISPRVARETLQVFAPLANRLGIWPIKWELEDLAFRFLEPEQYKRIALLLDEKRAERESNVQALRAEVEHLLAKHGITSNVQGRPKHIYSIVKKMRGKSLDFSQVFDVRALRVVVARLEDCYAALAHIHTRFTPLPQEFDDYIAKPKSNGYQSLHTVVRDDSGRPIEVQIRTEAMHQQAEFGDAAHWAYKEAGSKGYAGVQANGAYDAKIAVLRQLLAWERELSSTSAHDANGANLFDDRIYVLTPEAAVVELPQGATAIDFAYSVHTDLGHRCRGVRVDGAMVPLNTPLQNGQTVEITAAKEGGPSRDWLNADLGYLASPRARAKVRAWFNAQALRTTVARGREAVEKLLQREGKTALKLDDLANQLGFQTADALFEVVGKDELSLHTIENLLRPSAPPLAQDEFLLTKKSQQMAPPPSTPAGGVLVVGLDSLLTQLAKCCKPAPPDAIGGFVTRGKGVSVHRRDCSNFRELLARDPQRVIDVAWGTGSAKQDSVYPVDVAIEAADRQGLLRDISELFAREKMNVIGVQTQSVKGTAWMTFTVQIADATRLASVLKSVAAITGVRSARRR